MNRKARLLAVKHVIVPPVRTAVVWQTPPSLIFSYTITHSSPHPHPRGEGGRLRSCIDLGEVFSVSVDLTLIDLLVLSSHADSAMLCGVVLWSFFFFCATYTEVTAFFVCLCFGGVLFCFLNSLSSPHLRSVLPAVSHTSQYCRQCHIRLSIATSTTCIQLSVAASVTCIQLSIATSVTYVSVLPPVSHVYSSVLTPVSHTFLVLPPVSHTSQY